MSGSPGIYVEIVIRSDLEKVWQLTQEPALHERWDLRFSSIQYLPRPEPALPQQFLYQARIGFGLSIHGTGETVGTRSTDDGDTTSALKFASGNAKSLIRQGSGYWRYVPVPNGLRFFTWNDYTVRFGLLGRVADRLAFRPLIGWATAWSFDRLRLWAEEGQSPEASRAFAAIHAVARVSIAAIWIWHGLVPKLVYRHIDEQTMLAQSGVSLALLPWIWSRRNCPRFDCLEHLAVACGLSCEYLRHGPGDGSGGPEFAFLHQGGVQSRHVEPCRDRAFDRRLAGIAAYAISATLQPRGE